MSQAAPTAVQVDDQTQDAIDRAAHTLEEMKDSLDRIARALEAAQATGTD